LGLSFALTEVVISTLDLAIDRHREYNFHLLLGEKNLLQEAVFSLITID
jgi:hypothetical protein